MCVRLILHLHLFRDLRTWHLRRYLLSVCKGTAEKKGRRKQEENTKKITSDQHEGTGTPHLPSFKWFMPRVPQTFAEGIFREGMFEFKNCRHPKRDDRKWTAKEKNKKVWKKVEKLEESKQENSKRTARKTRKGTMCAGTDVIFRQDWVKFAVPLPTNL